MKSFKTCHQVLMLRCWFYFIMQEPSTAVSLLDSSGIRLPPEGLQYEVPHINKTANIIQEGTVKSWMLLSLFFHFIFTLSYLHSHL